MLDGALKMINLDQKAGHISYLRISQFLDFPKM